MSAIRLLPRTHEPPCVAARFGRDWPSCNVQSKLVIRLCCTKGLLAGDKAVCVVHERELKLIDSTLVPGGDKLELLATQSLCIELDSPFVSSGDKRELLAP